jgi:hypothetical protein
MARCSALQPVAVVFGTRPGERRAFDRPNVNLATFAGDQNP